MSLPELSKRQLKELERFHILRTLVHHGPMSAAELAHIANRECDHDALDDLPQISPRGITMKLQGMSLDHLVVGRYPGGNKPMAWTITDRGRHLAASLDHYLKTIQ